MAAEVEDGAIPMDVESPDISHATSTREESANGLGQEETSSSIGAAGAIAAPSQQTDGAQAKTKADGFAKPQASEKHSHHKPQAKPGAPVIVRPSEREYATDLVCKVKYYNTLPDLPFDPKMLAYPFDPMRFVKYRTSTVERKHKFDIHTDTTFVVPIDLVDPDTYRVTRGQLHEADRYLLDDDKIETTKSKDRAAAHAMQVNFLRKGEYLAPASEIRVYGGGMDAAVMKQMREAHKRDKQKKDRVAQIAAVERTFSQASTAITRHPEKRNVAAVEEIPFFPDFDLWRNQYTHVAFDGNPAPGAPRKPDKPEGPAWEEYKELSAAQERTMSLALLHNMRDTDSGPSYLGYFLPTAETADRLVEMASLDDESSSSAALDYKMQRAYNWKVKSTGPNEALSLYFLSFRDGQCVYNELPHTLHLRRRQKDNKRKAETLATLVHREPTLKEQRNMAKRVRVLETGAVEEDDEPEEEPEGTQDTAQGTQEKETDTQDAGEESQQMDVDRAYSDDGETAKSDDEEAAKPDGDEGQKRPDRRIMADLFDDSDDE